MAFNITEFASTFHRSGLHRPNQFLVIFDDRELSLHGEAAELPGRMLQTQDYRYFGPSRRIPFQTLYPEISMTFSLSGDLREREYFMSWQDRAIGDHRKRNSSITAASSDIGYYNSYVKDVEIRAYEEGDDSAYHSIILHEAFPAQVTAVPLSWAETDSNSKLNVQFMYHRFTDKGLGEYLTSSLGPGIDYPDLDNIVTPSNKIVLL